MRLASVRRREQIVKLTVVQLTLFHPCPLPHQCGRILAEKGGGKMDRYHAFHQSLELAKLSVQSFDFKSCPDSSYADAIADFIQTMTDRLVEIDDGNN